MIVQSKCKFCGKVLHLQIAEEYATLERKDPFKLIEKAACNRCGDYHMSRIYLLDKVKAVSEDMIQGMPKDKLPKAREVLTVLFKRYMRLISEFRRVPMPDWDDHIVEAVMNAPRSFGSVFHRIPALFATTTNQQSYEQRALE